MTSIDRIFHLRSKVFQTVTGQRLFNGLMVLVFAISTSNILGVWTYIFPHPKVIYVSPEGSNWHDGSRPARALKTIQCAADRSVPGSEIIILPGVYSERIHARRGGTREAPIVFRAQRPGTVTITGEAASNLTAQWIWKPEGDGIYSTTVDYPIYRLRWGNRTLYRVIYGGLAKFKELVARPHAMLAFYFESQRLYVFLGADRHPQDITLRTHRPVPRPREWGEFKSAQIWCEADHITFKSLQLDFGIGCGILLWNAAHITIQDCVFRGSTFGIHATRGLKPATGLTVANCLYHNFPQADWRKRWLSWADVYASYSSSSLVAVRDDQSIVRNNLIVHAGDGFRITTRNDRPIRHGALIEENLLAAGTDDAFEFDGPARKITVRHNLVYNFHQNLGISPVLDGPVLITDNKFLHPASQLNGSQIKLISNQGPTGPAIRNVHVSNNTFVGNWLYWTDQCPLKNIVIRNNLFAAQHLRSQQWPPGVVDQSNRYVLLPPDGYPNPGSQSLWLQSNDDHKQTVSSTHWSMPKPGPSWIDPWQHPCTRSALDGLMESVVR